MTAEFAGKRPFGSFSAFGENTEKDFGAGGIFGKVFDIGFTVGGKKSYAFVIEVFDIFCFLDGVAVAQT